MEAIVFIMLQIFFAARSFKHWEILRGYFPVFSHVMCSDQSIENIWYILNIYIKYLHTVGIFAAIFATTKKWRWFVNRGTLATSVDAWSESTSYNKNWNNLHICNGVKFITAQGGVRIFKYFLTKYLYGFLSGIRGLISVTVPELALDLPRSKWPETTDATQHRFHCPP